MKRKNRPSLDARLRAHWRGWIFRPLNPMPTLILRAAQRRIQLRAQQRFVNHMTRLEATGRKPGTPLDDATRVWNYVRQNGVRRPLTPRQQRRRAHKAGVTREALAGLLGTR